MKVIFDCTALSNWLRRPSGIQRVICELGKSLVEAMPDTKTAIFDKNGECYAYCPESRAVGEPITISAGDMIFASGHDWDYPEHFAHLCQYVENGVYFGLLCYDIIPIKFPFTYKPEFVARFESWLQRALAMASVCFTISDSTRNDVLDYAKNAGIAVSDITVLRLGDNIPSYTDTVSDEVKKKISEKYVLSVGTIEYRKNHIILLNAWRYMIQTLGINMPKLYIAGRQGLYDANVQLQAAGDPGLKGKVEILSGLSDSDLGALYASASFTVYPSIYEGWGLPVAESLCYGVPCITSHSTSMLEIAPDLTPFADPLMTNEWVEKIRDWVEHPAKLEQARENIKNHYQRVSWHDSALTLCEHLKGFERQVTYKVQEQERLS